MNIGSPTVHPTLSLSSIISRLSICFSHTLYLMLFSKVMSVNDEVTISSEPVFECDYSSPQPMVYN